MKWYQHVQLDIGELVNLQIQRRVAYWNIGRKGTDVVFPVHLPKLINEADRPNLAHHLGWLS